ncbi:MAG: tyrosine-type recombinase/integrase [Cellulosilyticaceae bacterium]
MARGRVYTPTKYALANDNNKLLLNDYLVELKSKKLRPNTLTQYMHDGRMLVCYIQENMQDKSLLDFNKKDFRELVLWLTEDRDVGNARFNRIFALIHGMMEYAEDEEDYEYEKNYAKKIKNLPKVPRKEVVFLTDAQILKIRNWLLDNKMYRECAYLDISYDSTSRIGEIAQMKREGLLENRYSNIVTGKRGKRFNVIIHERSIESLGLYLATRTDSLDELWVTTRTKARPLSANALYEWAKKMSIWLSKEEGKAINFAPHALRHSALENYDNGTHYMCRVLAEPRKFALHELQAMARHDSMDTTKSYLKPKENNVIEGMFGVKLM